MTSHRFCIHSSYLFSTLLSVCSGGHLERKSQQNTKMAMLEGVGLDGGMKKIRSKNINKDDFCFIKDSPTECDCGVRM
uniref:Putative secreted protein n=1 Tax=Anopheles darlingi TaxID=43151 RepID=A0A2M4DI23_ANODA